MPEDGIDRWLIRGQLRQRPWHLRDRFQAAATTRVAATIDNWLDTQPPPRGKVFCGDAGVRLPGELETTFGIDVVYVAADVIASQPSDTTIIEGVPTLAVEILSPSDTQEDIHEKVDALLAAQERNSRVLCYANANLTRDTQAGELRKFVQFWRDVAGRNPQWLYFDSKLVPYAELSWLTEQNIWFATIRRRGSAVLRRLASLPDGQWRSAVIDIPKRRHQHIEYVDERLRLENYVGEARQVAVRGLGREAPTLFLSNHLEISPRDMVTNYARRNGVEDALGSSVDFFHLDCLSSEVRLNVDLDTVLTVLAHGCYRWLATQLQGFGNAKPKSVYRKFVETSGAVQIEKGRRIVVYFDRRSHNPILREAKLDKASPPIPWLSNLRVEFAYT